MGVEVIHGNQVPGTSLPFSPAIRAGDFIFVSGQASVDDAGRLVADTFEGEVRRSFGNLQRVLAGAALDLSHVVQLRAYVRDEQHLPEYNRIYREYFHEPYPARTTLTGCLPPSMHFEVDAVAYAPR